MSTYIDSDQLVGRLAELLQQCSDGALPAHALVTDEEPLRRLAISSATMTSFLIAIEDEFDIVWETNLDPEVLASLAAIAAHIKKSRGAGRFAGQVPS